MKCKAYLKTKTNTLFPAHGYPAITQTHYSNLYQFFESGRPKHCVLKSNTILQPGFSRLVKLLCNPDISEQKVLDPFPCLQGVRPCPAHREQRGSRTRCQSSRSGLCLAHLVVFGCENYSCYSRLPHPTSLHQQVWSSATTVLSWPMHTEVASVFSAFHGIPQ